MQVEVSGTKRTSEVHDSQGELAEEEQDVQSELHSNLG